MNEVLSISASLVNESLTLFVGSGFSKYMTNNVAPSWIELFVECASSTDSKSVLFNQLFKKHSDGSFSPKYNILTCAQILDQKFKQEGKDLRDEIAARISERVNKKTVDSEKLSEMRRFFRRHPKTNIITTNYDCLFSDFIIPKSHVVIEGSAIPKISAGRNIFHIHGSVKKKDSIKATLSDYYDFINSKNYFSRKFYTLLQETTVVILGYSLDDFNLNTILNEVNSSRKESLRKADIFYVSREPVDSIIKEFYYNTYGIQTIQIKDLGKFFGDIERNFEKAKVMLNSAGNLKKVLSGKKEYEDEFLKLRGSLHEILIQAESLLTPADNDSFLKLLITVLKKKKQFSRLDGAWEQYHHLADWLIEIASRIVIRGSKIESDFLELVRYSFTYCSKEKYKGYSWRPYSEWNSRWKDMRVDNQALLQSFIKDNAWDPVSKIEQISN